MKNKTTLILYFTDRDRPSLNMWKDIDTLISNIYKYFRLRGFSRKGVDICDITWDIDKLLIELSMNDLASDEIEKMKSQISNELSDAFHRKFKK